MLFDKWKKKKPVTVPAVPKSDSGTRTDILTERLYKEATPSTGRRAAPSREGLILDILPSAASASPASSTASRTASTCAGPGRPATGTCL